MHKNDSQSIILRGMRMKFSPNVRDIILKNLQQLLYAKTMLPWQQRLFNEARFFYFSCHFEDFLR